MPVADMGSSVRHGRRPLRPARRASPADAGHGVARRRIARGRRAGVRGRDIGAYVPVGPVRLADTRRTPCGCTAHRREHDHRRRLGPRRRARRRHRGRRHRHRHADGHAGFRHRLPRRHSAAAGLDAQHPRRPRRRQLGDRRVGADGRIELSTVTGGDLVVDITGVFVAAARQRAGRFVPVAARRLVDTREPAVGRPDRPGRRAHRSAPAGVRRRRRRARRHRHQRRRRRAPASLEPGRRAARANGTSFLNVNGSGQAVAATAIMPVSSGGLTISTLRRAAT